MTAYPLERHLQSSQEDTDSIRLLLVDDEPGIRDSISIFLKRQGLDVHEAADGEQALNLLKHHHFPLVLSDISLPGRLNGLDILAYVKEHHPDCEVMMMTGHLDIDYAITALKQGALDYFKKPFLFEEIQMAVQRAIERRKLLAKASELQRLRHRQGTMGELHTQFMLSLAQVIDAKSPYTRTHSDRVSVYAGDLARELGLARAEIKRTIIGGKLHDIGKIGTPESILNKPGRLTPEERAIIEQHPLCGAELLQPICFMEPYLPIIRSHHENWDGTGYPDGLAGDDIPLTVQVVKIADYYDAITSTRPYREPMSLRQAIDTLEAEKGRGFHPDLVDHFLGLLERSPWQPRKQVPVAVA